MNKFTNIKIRILKDKILTKYKLQDKFDEVDKLKDELESTKKTYQEEIKKLMEPFKIDETEYIDNDLNSEKSTKSINLSTSQDNLDDLEIPEELNEPLIKPIKSIKIIKSTDKTDTNFKKNKNNDMNSDNTSNTSYNKKIIISKSSNISDSDSDLEQSQLRKFSILKSDLIEIDVKTKDHYNYWYHVKSKQLYSLDINTKKWSETKTKLYKTLKNEIEQIENKLNKSVKSKKINKKKIINETDSDSDSDSDKVKKSKSKLKSKTKYINESDESEDFEELLEK